MRKGLYLKAYPRLDGVADERNDDGDAGAIDGVTYPRVAVGNLVANLFFH